MRVQPSAGTVRELRAVVLALKLLDKDIKRDISKSIRETLNPIWIAAIGKRLDTDLDRAVFLKGARIAAGNPAKAMAGTSRRALSGGATPVELARADEFGAPTRATHEETYTRRDSSGGHEVTRHTKRQIPQAVKAGRIVYPAWAEVAPRMVSLWVQIIVRNIHEKLEGR